MALANRAAAAVGRRPVWLTGLVLAGTWALAVALENTQPKSGSPQGCGRNGTASGSGPLRGWAFWKRVLVRVYEEFMEDRLLSLAAGVVFYGLLALFPALTAVVSCYALFSDPATINSHLAILKQVMPTGGYDIMHQQISHIAASTTGDLSLAFFVSLGIALWSANAGLKAIIDALNIVYGVKELRSFIRLNVVSLIMTVCTIVGLLLAMAAVVVVPVVLSYLPLGSFGGAILAWLRWPALILLLMVGLALLYRFGPNRQNPRWQWFSAGNVFAVLGWLAGSSALSWYLSDFANYNATYGSLGAGVGLMMWLWVSAIVVLAGAELNTEIEAARSSTHKPAQDKIGGSKSV